MELSPAQLAADENTSPEVLLKLASSSNPIVRQNVVMNPNVTPDILLKLVEQFPRQVFNNPAIDLLLLETPNLFSGTSADALCSFLKREVPHRMIEYAANSTDERVKLALLMNSQISLEILEKLSHDRSDRVREAAELHFNLINNLENDYEEFARAKIRQETAKSEKKYREILGDVNQVIKLHDHIPRCISYYMNWFISSNKNDNQITLREVEKMIDEKKSVIDIASNPTISLEIIHKLLDYPDPYGDIGRRIAGNPITPVEILEELAKSNRHNAVHEAIALNPKTPISILEILLNKPRMTSGYVYAALGRNKNITANFIEKLVNKSQDALVPVFNNPKTPEILRLKLMKYFTEQNKVPISRYHPQDFINNSDIPGDFLELCLHRRINDIQTIVNSSFSRAQEQKQNGSTSLETIAFHPNMTPNGLKILLNYDDRSVRSSAIANYKTPQYITEVWGMSFLETLNQSELKTLASSFYATEELLRKLVNHKDIMVSRAAASNPCASDRILEDWETSPFYKDGALEQIMAEEQRLLDRWESSISPSNRLIVLLNSQTPVPILAKISQSTSWLERYTIVQNPNTPYSIIQKLENDGNYVVRTAAKARL